VHLSILKPVESGNVLLALMRERASEEDINRREVDANGLVSLIKATLIHSGVPLLAIA
jgi:hypothetical protein